MKKQKMISLLMNNRKKKTENKMNSKLNLSQIIKE